MEFMCTAHTDVGIRKRTNQDSVLIKVASTDYGKICLGVICDGMGGLAKGEVASATLIREYSEWFEKRLPSLLYNQEMPGVLSEEIINDELVKLVRDVNNKIADYGLKYHVSLGTTVVSILLFRNRYYILNVGDSRVYQINDDMIQMTKDQTYVQREMEMGRMTAEEARVHPQRNVLLQCIGASDIVNPEFLSGTYEAGTVFLLCSDGFRHLIEPQEFYERLNPAVLTNETVMRDQVLYLIELNKIRNERDNITAALIRAY